MKIGDGAGWNATCAKDTSTGCNPVIFSAACTTVTISDTYFTNTQTGLYLVGSPVAVIRPIFEDGEVGIKSWARATVVEPFFDDAYFKPGVAAEIQGSGLLFIGPFEQEYNFRYLEAAGSTNTTRAETSFITDSMGNITPEQWHAGSKIGELEITQLGKLSVAGQQLAPTRKHPQGRGRALAKAGRRGPRLSRRERVVRAMSKIAAPAE